MHNLPVGSKYSLNSKEGPYNVEYIYNPNMAVKYQLFLFEAP